MKPLTKWVVSHDNSHGSPLALLLLDGDEDRVLSIRVEGGQVVFTENCDGVYSARMSVAEARQALMEAMAWIESHVETSTQAQSAHEACEGCGLTEHGHTPCSTDDDDRCPLCLAMNDDCSCNRR